MSREIQARFDPRNHDNWTLDCRACGHTFGSDDQDAHTGGLMAAHWNNEHAGQPRNDGKEGDWIEDKPEVDLKWVGLGPAPKSRPR